MGNTANMEIPKEWLSLEYVIQHFSLEQFKQLLKYKDLTPDSSLVMEKRLTTVLHYCAQKGRPSHLRYLVESLGADPNKEFNGRTPLISALIGDSQVNFSYLIDDPRTDVNLFTQTRLNVILEAAKEGKEFLFEEILKRNIDVSLWTSHIGKISRKSINRWYEKYIIEKRTALVWVNRYDQHFQRIPKLLLREIAAYI